MRLQSVTTGLSLTRRLYPGDWPARTETYAPSRRLRDRRVLVVGLVAVAMWTFVLFTQSACGQPTVEQRLARLEARVDSLIAILGSSGSIQPAGSVLRDSQHLQWGIVSPQGHLLDKRYFVINHWDEWKIPYWVAYHLTASDLLGDVDRTDDFRPDPELSGNQRSELIDYKRSGFDRGHNAPAADFSRSDDAMSTTFLLSNMSPQTPALNQRIWALLESAVRNLVRTEGDAWIVTGNIFMNMDSTIADPAATIGPGKVAVPTHCFKTILSRSANGEYRAIAFLMPNQRERIPGTIADYLLRVDRLEEITGFDFFPDLADSLELRLEQQLSDTWIQ